jgi:hypothetical protein
MVRYIAVFTFLPIVGVCSYVVLNPASYSTLVLYSASFVLCVAILAVAPVCRVILLLELNRGTVSPGLGKREPDSSLGRSTNTAL